ncbi:hypothetical protein RUM44_012942 [Polyplax serrata]|uniref:Uncharacterized protein n=1 Tax=Polyplax serrata TaxID=468196 RepID=A0ABR1BCR3_POLSC
MQYFREIEAIRRPGSPQLEVTKVRGSWRDYLDPVEYSDVDYLYNGFIEYDFGYHFEYDEDECDMDACDFEPFSDTCEDCENEGGHSDTDMESLDLTLFEPNQSETTQHCCCQCFNRNHSKAGFGYLMISREIGKSDKELQIGPKPSNSVKETRIPLVTWEPYFCVLLQDEQTLTAYRSEELSIGDALFVDLPRIRLDGGAKAFRQRWGYEVSPPPTLMEVEEEGEEREGAGECETVSLKEDGHQPALSPTGKR